MRHLRIKAGRSQDELAAAAQECGLDWTRASVASLEVGRRGLTAAELLLLPTVLWTLTGEPVRPTDLVEPDREEPIALTPQHSVGASTVRALLGGQPHRLTLVPTLPQRDAVQRAARKLGVTAERLEAAASRRWGRGLLAERDARMAARTEPAGDERAVRGHVTRQLLTELAEELGTDDEMEG